MKPVTVLVAEDHKANRQVIRRRLERRGFLVDEACDGVEAVDAFSVSPCACVLMDLSMPNMSGLEALKRIRQTPPGDIVPAIAITAHATDAIKQACLLAGFDAVVSKPMNFEELVATITALSAEGTS